MKTPASLFIAVFGLFSMAVTGSGLVYEASPQQKQLIAIHSDPGSEALATQWVSDYNAAQSDYQAILGSEASLFLAADSDAAGEAAWKTIIARNPMVFIRSAGSNVMTDGLSADRLHKLINRSDAQPALYVADIPGVREAIAHYMGTDPAGEPGISILPAHEILHQLDLHKDVLAFLPWMALTNPAAYFENKQVIPIDLNGDGQLNAIENITHNEESFLRGVWIGKYPRELCESRVLFSRHIPLNEAEASFAKYVLTAGQKRLVDFSLAANTVSEQASGLSQIPLVPSVRQAEPVKASNRALIISMTILVVLFIVVWLGARWKRISHRIRSAANGLPKPFRIEEIKTPGGVLFGPSHTWTFMEQDGAVKLGIDDFIQHITGPITRIDLKPSGTAIHKGDVMASLTQNGKRIDVLAPVSGTVIEMNASLMNAPALLNESPFGKGWIYRIEPSNWSIDLGSLILPRIYRERLVTEVSRLKDFIQQARGRYELQTDRVIMNDGGDLCDEVLSLFGPEIWDDFGDQFMKNQKYE